MGHRPFFIGIAGESGVGKSTIANIVSLFLGSENTLRISTDDLHKWERTSPNWQKFTHLNPAANNLELGDLQIVALSQGQPIYRSVYNHTSGVFDPPARMEAKKYVINEGLHAFYTEDMQEILDLKIFVETDEDLRIHWKLLRDTEQRGYKFNDVIEAINKRKRDSGPIREKQMNSADAVIRLGTTDRIASLGCKTSDITLTIDIEYRTAGAEENPLFDFIRSFTLDLNDFVRMSKAASGIELCQNSGGNVSVKVADSVMLIKASGYEMKDIHGLSGHSVVRYHEIRDAFDIGIIKDDRSLVKTVSESVPLREYRRPSMETGFHAYLDRYVVHTHPVYLNVLLCLEHSKEIVDEVFSGYSYTYLDYKNPGFEVCAAVVNADPSDVYFLANHGLIVCGSEAVARSIEINNLAKEYLRKTTLDFREFSLEFADQEVDMSFFYPDSAVFLDEETPQKREILAAHNYISKMSKRLGRLRLLSKENVLFLQNLESETYRKGL